MHDNLWIVNRFWVSPTIKTFSTTFHKFFSSGVAFYFLQDANMIYFPTNCNKKQNLSVDIFMRHPLQAPPSHEWMKFYIMQPSTLSRQYGCHGNRGCSLKGAKGLSHFTQQCDNTACCHKHWPLTSLPADHSHRIHMCQSHRLHNTIGLHNTYF